MVGGGAYQRVAERPSDPSPPPRTFRTGAPVHTSQGHRKPGVYSRPCSCGSVRSSCPAYDRGPDGRSPDQILLRTVWHALHVRVSAAAREAPQGRQGPVARPEELRPVRRLVARRGDGRRPQRHRSRDHRAAAGRLPPDVQLLHDVPAVHVRELLERGRGHLPDVLAAPRARDPAGPVPGPGSGRPGSRSSTPPTPRTATAPRTGTAPSTGSLDLGAWPVSDFASQARRGRRRRRDSRRPTTSSRSTSRLDSRRSPSIDPIDASTAEPPRPAASRPRSRRPTPKPAGSSRSPTRPMRPRRRRDRRRCRRSRPSTCRRAAASRPSAEIAEIPAADVAAAAADVGRGRARRSDADTETWPPPQPPRPPRCCTASAPARTSMPRSRPTNASRPPLEADADRSPTAPPGRFASRPPSTTGRVRGRRSRSSADAAVGGRHRRRGRGGAGRAGRGRGRSRPPRAVDRGRCRRRGAGRRLHAGPTSSSSRPGRSSRRTSIRPRSWRR